MRTWIAALGLLLLAVPASAQEQPPTLADYLAAAKKNNPSQRISRADLLNAEAARTEALSAVLPTVNAQGNWTYNQYDARVSFGPGQPEIVISPHEQTDASLSARAPLFDGPALSRYRAARIAAAAAADDSRATEAEVLLAVARAYYDCLAAQETLRAAERSRGAAEQNAKIARTRVEAGAVTALVAERAELELSRGDQAVIEAKRAWQIARRSLSSLTGLPEPGSLPVIAPDETPVAPEDSWQARAVANRPDLASGIRRVQVARLAKQASWLQYAPVLTAHGTERYTNAKGFVGHETQWSAGITADWLIIELGQRVGETKKARAEVLRAEARLGSERAAVRDDVHNAWLTVDAALAKLTAARHGADVAGQAASEMRVRFSAGTTTQLEVTQSERDLLQAEVDRIRAESDLAFARLALAKAAGDEIR